MKLLGKDVPYLGGSIAVFQKPEFYILLIQGELEINFLFCIVINGEVHPSSPWLL